MSKTIVLLCVLVLVSVASAAEVGVLTRVALDPNTRPPINPYEDQLNSMWFAQADANAGTTNPHAVVTTITGPFGVLAVAIDSRESGAAKPDVLRIDFSGQGKFAQAPTAEIKSVTEV
jgi:hypothetical protein